MADTRVDPKTGLTFAQASSKGVSWTAPKDPQGFAILTSPTTTTPAATTVAKTTAPVTTAPVTAPVTASTYKIVSGDTLSQIAAKYGTTVTALMAANPNITNPNLIYAGATLNLPTTAASLVAGTVSPTIPNTTAPDVDAAILTANSTEALIKQMQEQIAKMNAQSEKLATQNQAALDKLMTPPAKSQTELLQEQYGQWAVPETVSQIKGITQTTLPLYQQIATLTNAETAEIERVSQMGMSEGWKERKTIDTQNKYNKLKAPIAVQLNAYAAQINALQGNLSIAQSFISAAVNAATYDQEFAYNQMRDFISINQSFLSSLTQQQQFLFSNSLDLLQNDLNNAREDKTNVGNLMLQYPSAGITLNDTIDTATTKASQWSAAQPVGGVGGVSIETDTRKYIQDPTNPYASIPNPDYGKPLFVGEVKETAILNQLNASKGTDGYVDPNVYLTIKATSDISSSEFDKRFSYLLSPIERERLGITETGTTKWEKESTVWQWLATPEAMALSDEEKAQQIKAFGLDPQAFGIY